MNSLIKIFLNLKIAHKLIIGYAAVGFLLVVGTGVGLLTTSDFKNRLGFFYSDHVVPNNQMVSIQEDGYQIQSALEGYFLNPGDFKPIQSDLETRIGKIDQQIQALANSTNDGAHLMAVIKSDWVTYKNQISSIETEIQNNQLDQAKVLLNSGLKTNWNGLRTDIDDWKKGNLTALTDEIHYSDTRFIQVVWALIITGFIGVVISQVVGVVVAGTIVNPLKIVKNQLLLLSNGENARKESFRSNTLTLRKDEIGDLARSLGEVHDYLDSVTVMADEISGGNLIVQVKPRGNQDQLGHALLRMVEQLSHLVNQVASNSGEVGIASKRLAQAAAQTNQATGQISTTIRRVADGINRQSVNMNQTMDVIQTTNVAIHQVARGAVEQEHAVVETRHAAEEMDLAIRQMIQTIRAVSESTIESTGRAEDGVKTLKQTVESMQEIRKQVEDLDGKIDTVGNRSDEIGTIIDVIEDIATKTNILAINATIEAAHAEVQAKKLTEEILDVMMVAECQMVNQMLVHYGCELGQAFLKDICASTHLDTILITDLDGITVQSNEDVLMGWRFSDDPKAQAFPFRQLLQSREGIYCQNSQPRDIDKKNFKYVGVSRVDSPGIVQIGLNMNTLKKFDLRINGFAVVAAEVYQLAERARQSTREIRVLIKGIQGSVSETVQAMQESSKEVEIGMDRAGQAGAVLQQIMESVQEVSRQVHLALDATARMQILSKSLDVDVTTFDRIVVENNSSVKDLNLGYGHIARTIEAVASLGEQNSTAAQQVSSSSEDMRAQMEEVKNSASQLESMAENLEDLISHYQY